ncbi:MAG: hypothetical protein H6650_11980 [Ardenticatenales bacterium]|nr:hypothetical protein [Ardenticatenales bacterium]
MAAAAPRPAHLARRCLSRDELRQAGPVDASFTVPTPCAASLRRARQQRLAASGSYTIVHNAASARLEAVAVRQVTLADQPSAAPARRPPRL